MTWGVNGPSTTRGKTARPSRFDSLLEISGCFADINIIWKLDERPRNLFLCLYSSEPYEDEQENSHILSQFHSFMTGDRFVELLHRCIWRAYLFPVVEADTYRTWSQLNDALQPTIHIAIPYFWFQQGWTGPNKARLSNQGQANKLTINKSNNDKNWSATTVNLWTGQNR